jgi:hypothetical protein
MVIDLKKIAELLINVDELLQKIQQKAAKSTSADEMKSLYEKTMASTLISRVFLDRYHELRHPQFVAKAATCTTVDEIDILKSKLDAHDMETKNTTVEQREEYDIYSSCWVDLLTDELLGKIQQSNSEDELEELINEAECIPDSYLVELLCEMKYFELFKNEIE